MFVCLDNSSIVVTVMVLTGCTLKLKTLNIYRKNLTTVTGKITLFRQHSFERNLQKRRKQTSIRKECDLNVLLY